MSHDAWSDRPRERDQMRSFTILRTPKGRDLRGIVLSDQHVGVYTHFWQGRTTVCRGDECEACRAGRAPRWYGYIYLWLRPLNQIAIFEFPQRAFDPFDAYFTQHGTQRGAMMTARRLNKKDNGPVQISFEAEPYTSSGMPTPVDLKAVLCRIWEVPEKRKVESFGPQYDETLIHEQQPRSSRRK